VITAVIVAVLAFGGWFLSRPSTVRLLTGSGYNLRVVQDTRSAPPARLHGVDLRTVHANLMPDWWIAAAGSSAGKAREAADAMIDALAGDATLTGLFAEIQPLVALDPLENYGAIATLFRTWNEYLDGEEASWFVETGTQGRAFFVKSYEVVADSEVQLAGNYPDWGRQELSAYLAAFASERIGVTSLLRACMFADHGASRRHVAAIELVNESFALDGAPRGPWSQRTGRLVCPSTSD
jgi:hypothetical protein